jgi:cyclopropane fatty-acyl-phospholipid synthase-like methyltransferase
LTSRAAAPRLVWAVEALALEPDDHVLEVGCGHGVAVSLACERLDSGTVTAIDRSPKMVEAARRRNAANIASGRATVECVAFEDADFGGLRFDKVFGFHVADFWRRPHDLLPTVRQALVPDGTLTLFEQPLSQPDNAAVRDFASTVEAALAREQFALRDVASGRAASSTVIALTFQPWVAASPYSA